MKVSFVLPGGAAVPSGGARMVLRYANALAASGWTVSIILPSALRGSGGWWGKKARQTRYWWWRFNRGYSPHRWFQVLPGVGIDWVQDLRRLAASADVVIATSVQTAESISHWPASGLRLLYLVQGYETWDFPAERVKASWRLPFVKLAVSRWLCDLIKATGESAVYLPNGADPIHFGVDRPIELRKAPHLLWPFHSHPQKGAADVLAVLPRLRAQLPELSVHAFGVASIGGPQRDGIRYHQNPAPAELRRLYNEARVFAAPSHAEGWGLPPFEAQQCGCAVAGTDIGGHREFLRNEENALLHPAGDTTRFASNLLRLLTDDGLSQRLATRGQVDAMGWRFEASVDRLQRALRGEDVI